MRCRLAGVAAGTFSSMTPDEFRRLGHEVIDWIADYRESLPTRHVQATALPGDVRRQIPTVAPLQPESLAEILEDLDRIVMPGLSHFQHPRFHGYFPANASLESVLGDVVSTGLGVIGITWQSSPALTEVEEAMMEWLRVETGLSTAWTGTIQDTASTACLVALLCARERSSGFGMNAGGLQAAANPLVIYASSESHSSVQKAAVLAGFGLDNLRFIGVDPHTFGMDTELLERAIVVDLAAGRVPCAVIASVGTTATTAVDPVHAIVGIAQRHALWVHVDAALAGTAMLLPECRHLWDGIEGADSLSWNPHKWMGTAVDCSAYFVRDPQHLIRVMSTNPSYLRSAVDGEVTQFRDWGIPLGRRFRALKLWFHMRLEGLDAIRARLRRDLDNARWLADTVISTPRWSVLAPVPLQTVCLRYTPTDATGAPLIGRALDAHTLAWCDEVNQGGLAYLTPSLLQERWMVRVSIGALTTERSDVATTWAAIRSAAERPPRAGSLSV